MHQAVNAQEHSVRHEQGHLYVLFKYFQGPKYPYNHNRNVNIESRLLIENHTPLIFSNILAIQALCVTLTVIYSSFESSNDDSPVTDYNA